MKSISIFVRKRIITQSRMFQDKWGLIEGLKGDTLKIYLQNNQEVYVVSKMLHFKYIISRDELAFVKLILTCYGSGDYSILISQPKRRKGATKIKGWRRFWDGIITENAFIRRRDVSGDYRKLSPSLYERDNLSMNIESYISNYFKTKRPGMWYNL